jgi:hypothetical protein
MDGQIQFHEELERFTGLGIHARFLTGSTAATPSQKGNVMTPRVQLGLVGALIVALACVCFADTQERVTPPQDQSKLHVSVVGIVNNAEYQRVLSWFNNDQDLAALRKATHFHAVNAGSAIYDARYKANIKGLPTVRLQDARGEILYESHGSGIPRSPSALCDAIESKTGQVFNPPLLPWRRKIQNNCDNGQCGPQQQEITPEDLMQDEFSFDEAPLPEFVEPEPEGISVLLAVVLCLLAGGGGFAGAILGSVKREMQ